MFSTILSRTFRRTLLALALGACASLASAATSFHVEVDTSGFGGAADGGWLDLQFNPGYVDGVAASATLSHFSGFDGGIAALSEGDVSGSLAGGFVIGNGSAYNDLFHAVHFGGKLSFDVSFSGMADPGAKYNSSLFLLSLYGADASTQLGAANPIDGSLLSFSWTPGQGAATQGSVLATIEDGAVIGISAVPEPSAWLMLAGGLALTGALARRRARLDA
ncbi:PEP-CTERM sorting domain-containing protein [Oxalobacteraceae bacterium]|nr:PEP-CTERM sorting domain-containing protein [Oxalobacteraceae bacterium]